MEIKKIYKNQKNEIELRNTMLWKIIYKYQKNEIIVKIQCHVNL